MGLNLDIDTGYTAWGTEPTAAEIEEINRAKYVVRQIGKPAVHGYSDSQERALGVALHHTLTNMLEEGMVVDVQAVPHQHIELRISEDRLSTTVKWVPVAPEMEPVTAPPTPG